MRARTTDCDIAIAGGGMVGVSLGLLLAARLARGTRILLLEGFPLPARDDQYEKAYTPSFDARATALSYSSYQIYKELGIWPALARRACPIRSIHVSERGRFGSTLLRAQDQSWDALGYVVENAWLGATLIQQLYLQVQLVLRSPARVSAVLAVRNGYRLSLEAGDQVRARLLVVADGADSSLRRALDIPVHSRSYRQYALIANVGHAADHGNCAYERFTGQGPLAMLPLLADSSGGPRSALVWTLPEALARELSACPEAEFLQRLQRRFGYRLGRLRKAGERFSYPLALVQAEEQVRRGLILLGNAAHSLHPVAGQGFNLALRDAVVFAQVLAAAQRNGEDLADLSLLQRYENLRQGDQARTLAFTDRLPRLFGHPGVTLRSLRDLGLFTLDISPALKRQFVQQAAGAAAGSRQAGEQD